MLHNVRRIAGERDDVVIEARREEAEAAAALAAPDAGVFSTSRGKHNLADLAKSNNETVSN